MIGNINMADVHYKQGGHDITVQTTERSIPGHELRTTYVDSKPVSIADHDTHTGETNEYTHVNQGICGPTPSGTFKK
jgi:hypothetical protein